MKNTSGKHDVDAYIAAAPKQTQATLKQLRRTIRAAAPQADERLSYKMPFYYYHGRVAYFAAWKDHVSMYGIPTTLTKFQKQIAPFLTSKSTLKFPLGTRLPVTLIANLVKAQVKANNLNKRKKGY